MSGFANATCDRQYDQYNTYLELFLQNPSSTDDNSLISLREQIDFVAHVADSYPTITANFPEDLIKLLGHHEELEHETREKVVGSLVLLRNKEVITSELLLRTLFPILITTTSKTLRQLLFSKVISDLRTSNSKTTNHRLNKTIQTVSICAMWQGQPTKFS